MGLAVYDLANRAVPFVNDKFLALAGLTRIEFESGTRTFIDATDPADRATDERARAQLLAGHPVAPYEKTFVHPDGRRVRVLLSTDHAANGLVVVTAQDVSAVAEARQALATSEEHVRRFLELSPQIAWTTDASGAFLDLSPRRTAWTGMSREETFAYGWTEIIHPDDRAALVDPWMQSLRTGAPLDAEARLRMRNGAYRWIRSRAYPSRDGEGRIERWYGVTEDVHDRAVAERARRETEERFRHLADAMPQLVWTASPTGRVDYHNARRYQYWGPMQSGAGGYDWAPIVHPEDLEHTVEVWDRAVATGEDYVCEHRIRRADGAWAWHLSRATAVRDADGAIAQWYGTATDIDAVKAAQAHRELLVRELDHRVKNTLALVQSIAHQTLRGDQTFEDARSALVARLSALGGAHALLTSQTWRALELRVVVEDALRALPAARWSMDGPAVELAPHAAVAFAMALHELATNALKYGALSADGGQVHMDWRPGESGLDFTWRETGGPPVHAPPGADLACLCWSGRSPRSSKRRSASDLPKRGSSARSSVRGSAPRQAPPPSAAARSALRHRPGGRSRKQEQAARMSTSERIALVTGATRGIGRAAAIALGAARWRVVALGRAQKALEALDDAIRAAGGPAATLVPIDLKAPEGLDHLAAALAERFGRVDGLVAAAGVLGDLTPAAQARTKIWDEVIAVNLTANWRLIRAMDPLLRAAPAGRAVFLTSGAAHRVRPYWGPYAASKAALEALVTAYSQEVAFSGVRVNLFNPGPTRTAMRAKAFPGENPATLPTPEDVVQAMLPLLDPAEDRVGAVVAAA